MLRRLWRRGQQAYPLRRVEAMPRSLRHDDHHPGAHRKGFRTVLSHDMQRRRAIDDLHELVAVRMSFPRSVARKFGAEDIAVANRSHRGEAPAPLSLDVRRLRSA